MLGNFFQAAAEPVKMQPDNMEQAGKMQGQKSLWFLHLGTQPKASFNDHPNAFRRQSTAMF